MTESQTDRTKTRCPEFHGWKGLTRNVHVKYESPTSNGSNVMVKIKVFKYVGQRSRSRSLGPKFWYGLTRNVHVKYESPALNGSKIMAKVKGFFCHRVTVTIRRTGQKLDTPEFHTTLRKCKVFSKPFMSEQRCENTRLEVTLRFVDYTYIKCILVSKIVIWLGSRRITSPKMENVDISFKIDVIRHVNLSFIQRKLRYHA